VYLKSLTIKGFKSFASSTTLLLEPGITCVVGPNGSGKSNVVDAISWVMGEQGAKSLRGGKMEDVIFAGTSGRAPLGRAEVALTIDNSDGSLPIDYSEVTISRILFRNGQSEYQINGEGVRLLDIQELLSDSGIGREMHVIVGQGQLDAILMATPEERRAFIEEAAGVLKHRKRKEKALRKLDSMQANMARVQDLTVELRRQLKPLGKQAEVAKKAATIQADLRDVKLRLLADDYISMSKVFSAEVADENALRERRAIVEADLEGVRAREEALDAAAAFEGPLLNSAQETYYALTGIREKLRAVAALAQERTRFLTQEIEIAAGRDPEALESEASLLRKEEAELRIGLNSKQDELNQAINFLRNLESDVKSEEDRIAAMLRAIADQREGTARQEGHIKSLQARLDAMAQEITRLTKARDDANTRAQNAQREYAQFELDIASADSGETGLDNQFESAKRELDIAKEHLAKLMETEREADRKRNSIESKLEALKLASRNRDGSSALLSDSRGVKILGSLASLLNIEPGYESAVSAALGDLADSLVVQDLNAAVIAITALRNENLGQAELLLSSNPEISMSRLPSGLAPLINHVSGSEVVGLLSGLLQNVVIAESARAAAEILNSHPDLTVVTREGDLFTKTRVRGGSKSANSMIEIQTLINKLSEDLVSANHECEKLGFEIQNAQHVLSNRQSSYDQALSRLNDSDARISALTEQLAVAGQNIKSANSEVERLNIAITEAANERVADERELEIAQNQLGQRVEISEPDHSQAEVLREKLTGARSAEVEARLAVRTAEERVNSIAERAASLEAAAQAERLANETAISRRANRAKAAVISQAIGEAAYETLVHIERSIAKAGAERSRLEESKQAREGETLAIRSRNRELTQELEQLTSSVHRDELARSEQRLRIEALASKALEDFGIDVETLQSEYGPHKDVPTFIETEDGQIIEGEHVPYRRDQQEKRLAQTEKALNLLGKINPLALEEYTSVEERLKFLTEQLEDLKRTKKDLLDIVKEVDDRVQSIFMEAYEETAKQFKDIFARLFPGGEGRLILTEPDNLLTTGVDIEARPPGKRIKRLSLLSGGEKSLTVVAMLVAIFKSRPSPFYILDEVEAALDDVNLQRLLGVLEDLRTNSQLIIITHQKRTMEVADALYGVTMRGDGVSEVISQRLRETETA
jgi:chromosome segregation protein